MNQKEKPEDAVAFGAIALLEETGCIFHKYIEHPPQILVDVPKSSRIHHDEVYRKKMAAFIKGMGFALRVKLEKIC